jgi:hypothetical protein
MCSVVIEEAKVQGCLLTTLKGLERIDHVLDISSQSQVVETRYRCSFIRRQFIHHPLDSIRVQETISIPFTVPGTILDFDLELELLREFSESTVGDGTCRMAAIVVVVLLAVIDITGTTHSLA